MTELNVQIPTAHGLTEGAIYAPEKAGRWPGVIQYTDIGGIRPSQQEMAGRLAEAGYVVLMPNVFYRTGPLPLFDFPRKFGEERTTKRLAELSRPPDSGGHRMRCFGLRRLSHAARFRQTRLDGRSGILLHRKDGGLYRDVATRQDSGGSFIPRRWSRHPRAKQPASCSRPVD